MKFCFAILLVAYLIPNNSYSQDYSSNNLPVIYGKTFYTGKTDCDAKVKLFSKNNKIVLQVAVKDDTLVFKDNIAESDHIEVWFNMDTLYNDYFVYNKVFYAGDTITPSTKKRFIDYLNSRLFQTEDDKLNKSSVDPKDVPIVKEINGMMHWGINIQKGSTYLFDQEYYLKLPINDSVKNKISIKKEIVKGGYNVNVAFHPEALLFFRKNIVNDLVFLVDVFDVDKTIKDLSVLSTSAKRRWGAPETFTTTKLKKPLKISEDLNPFNLNLNGFYFFKNNKWRYFYTCHGKEQEHDEFYPYSFKELISHKSTSKLVDGEIATLYSFQVEPYEGYKGTISKLNFQNQFFSFESFVCDAGAYEIKKINSNDYAVRTTSCKIKNPWGSGECGTCVFKEESFFILKDKKSNPIFSFIHSEDGQRLKFSKDYVNGELLSSKWNEQYDGIDIDTKEYDYTVGNLNPSCFHYKITWDNFFKSDVEKKNITCTEK